MDTRDIKVGVGLLIVKDGKILMSIRKGKPGLGEGQHGLVGGHVEYGETLQEAVLRELAEECGITVKNVRLLCVADMLNYPPKHYVDVGFTAEWASGEPQILEPEKCAGWEWVPMDDLPADVFATTREYIEAYKTGKHYFTLRP